MEPVKQFVGEKYNLRWNSHKNSLVNYLSDHLLAEELVDITLACTGKYIKAHKLILSACSTYFRELFHFHRADNPSMIILNNVKFEELKYIIDFIYNGEIKVLDSELEGVLLLGNNLQIKGLSNIRDKNPARIKSRVMLDETTSKTRVEKNGVTKQLSNQSNPEKIDQELHENISKNIKSAASEKCALKQCKITVSNKNVLNTSECGNLAIKEDVIKNKSLCTNDSNNGSLNKANMPNEVETQSSKRRKIANLSEVKPIDKIQLDSQNITTPVNLPGSSAGNDIDNSIKIEVHDFEDNTLDLEENIVINSPLKPVSAFMIFAREWRKKLAVEHPNEGNKQISVRLSNMWKNLSDETKETFYVAASKAYEEQKSKIKRDLR